MRTRAFLSNAATRADPLTLSGQIDPRPIAGNTFARVGLPPNPNWPAPIPKEGDPINALDYWGCNRPSEATLNAAFGRSEDNAGYDPYCDPGSSDCSQEAYMGYWINTEPSDGLPGTPISPMLIGSEAVVKGLLTPKCDP
jgi:hypothetical protein